MAPCSEGLGTAPFRVEGVPPSRRAGDGWVVVAVAVTVAGPVLDAESPAADLGAERVDLGVGGLSISIELIHVTPVRRLPAADEELVGVVEVAQALHGVLESSIERFGIAHDLMLVILGRWVRRRAR